MKIQMVPTDGALIIHSPSFQISLHIDNMILGWMVTVCCLASSVLGTEDGVRKKLVRRRKGGDWLEGEAASARNSAPVKRVFKRKIVRTGSGEAAVVRRKLAHLLPEQQRVQHQPPPTLQITNQSLPALSTNSIIPHKPMAAKRCEEKKQEQF